MKNNTLKIVGTVAIVGTLAALALFNISTQENHSTFLASTNDPVITAAFSNFVSKHHKSYITKSEHAARFAIFRDNYEAVQQHNLGNPSHKLAINNFGDWSASEMSALLTFKQPVDDTEDNSNVESDTSVILGAGALPVSVDWRTSGAVSSIKNQGSCGSCYTFSSAGAMEGAYKIKTGNLMEFSAQQLLDCTGYPNGNSGCQGGYMTNCFKWLKSNKIMPQSKYAYTGIASSCKNVPSLGVVGVSSYTALPANNPSALLAAVAIQPVSVAIASSSYTFYFYKSGVINTTACGTSINHAVLLIGYGRDTTSNLDYWLVKNSWGAAWGESGFLRVYRDNVSGPGICGILKLSSYPTL